MYLGFTDTTFNRTSRIVVLVFQYSPIWYWVLNEAIAHVPCHVASTCKTHYNLHQLLIHMFLKLRFYVNWVSCPNFSKNYVAHKYHPIPTDLQKFRSSENPNVLFCKCEKYLIWILFSIEKQYILKMNHTILHLINTFTWWTHVRILLLRQQVQLQRQSHNSFLAVWHTFEGIFIFLNKLDGHNI